MNKKTLRKELIRRRADMEENVRKVLCKKIYNNLVSHERVKNARVILTYASAKNEVDTLCFIEKMLSENKIVAVPKCEGKNMRFLRIRSLSELVTSSFGVPESSDGEEIFGDEDSVCITPGLSFDTEGYRLGYGGGFYDRFLKDYRGYSIGLCYSGFIGEVPAEEHDIKVDEVMTEHSN